MDIDTFDESLVDYRELVRRLRQLVESSRELGSVHTVAQIEIEPTARIQPGELQRVIDSMSARIRRSNTFAGLDRATSSADRARPADRFRYVLVLHHCPLEQALEVAQTLLTAIRSAAGADSADADNAVADNARPAYRTSIGLAPFSAEARNASELLKRGRLACREARDLGGDQIQIFRSEESDRARKQHEILRAAELLQAIEQDQLHLFGQEIVPLKPGLPPLVEVLLRMPDGNGGHIPPAAFVRAAERYDLAVRLDGWVVTAALAGYQRLFVGSEVGLSINLSAQSVGDEEFRQLIEHRLKEYEVPPERVCFEITETAAVRGVERASAFIDSLRSLGCRFALDDFGSGQTSLPYLKELTLDYLKIDRGFVCDVLEEDFDLAIVEAAHRIGEVLGIQVVAEGVESREVLERIREIGLDYAQGYIHGRPQPLEELRRTAGRHQPPMSGSARTHGGAALPR